MRQGVYNARTANPYAPKCERCGHGYWPYADTESGPSAKDADVPPYCHQCLDDLAAEEYDRIAALTPEEYDAECQAAIDDAYREHEEYLMKESHK